MRRIYTAVGSLIFFITIVSGGSSGQVKKPLTADDIDQLKSLEDMISSLDELRMAADRLTRAKFQDCLKAFGYLPFCECLRDKAPVSIGFQTYVRLLTTSKVDLNYKQLNEQDRKLVDATYQAREACVASLPKAR
jgi:hypothetical protein